MEGAVGSFISFSSNPFWLSDFFVDSSVKLSFWRLLGKHMSDYKSGIVWRNFTCYLYLLAIAPCGAARHVVGNPINITGYWAIK